MKLPAWLIPTGIIAYFLFQKGSANILSKIDFKFLTVNPDLINLSFQILFSANNPLPTDLTISSILGRLEVDGKIIAEFYQVSPTILKPGLNRITVNAFPKNGNILSDLNKVLSGKKKAFYTITAGPLSYSDSLVMFE